MRNKRFQTLRRWVLLAQPVILLGLPFLKVGGESALRFDLPRLRLYFFGRTIWMDEFFIVLVVLIFLILLFLLLTLLFGRIWCGWACPQTVLLKATRFLTPTSGRRLIFRVSGIIIVVFLSLLVAADLIWYFMTPEEFSARLVSGNLGPVTGGIWAGLALLVFCDLLFLRQRFCATVCPYSMIQNTICDSRTLRIVYDKERQEECGRCSACVAACPVGIDIREGGSRGCIQCSECVDACAGRMELKGAPSLVEYRFGESGGRMHPFRPNVLPLGVLTCFFLILVLFMILNRPPLEVTLMAKSGFPPRRTATGWTVNAFDLTIRNRLRRSVPLKIKVLAEGRSVRLKPAGPISVPERGTLRIPLFLSIAGYHAGFSVHLVLQSDPFSIRIEKGVPFRKAEAP
ncbi:MAG: 4Fe-4S binding protein [Deltaproteobacteria bacterium]|nr:4Fe-4S binding protein [Deltaproteobacteria bacterium]